MSEFIETLSILQARKLVLLSQKIPPIKKNRAAIRATQAAIEQLGYIQIDTISVVERAHHHTLWNRNPSYNATHLDELLKKKRIFEYWSHAAAYLPICDYRYSLPRKMAIANGTQKHWYKQNEKFKKSILKRISEEGPLMLKDFKNQGLRKGDWTSTPTKQALESLFMQGDLMIPNRKSFHKIYDLTERVLPDTVDASVPTPKEHARFLICSYLKANGLGQLNEMVYLLKNVKPMVATTLKEMVAAKELLRIRVKEEAYYMLPTSLELLDKRLDRNTVKILSPFDNLLIQRKRMKALFNFDYLIECYVPKAKRKYGYFSLPILWNGKLVARLDCKHERKTGVLHIFHLSLEPSLIKMDAFALAFCKELIAFMKFNQCQSLEIHKTSPANFNSVLQEAIRVLM